MTKAFAYLRVSSKGQIDGDGFDRQIEAIRLYAGLHHYEITEVFREQGISGAKDLEDRPALSELLAALDENGVKTVLIEKLDRLARDVIVQETILADFKRNGYTLISAQEPDLCTDDPSRVLIRVIFGAIAEYDKKMIVLRMRGARQRIKARGRNPGAKHYSPDPKLNKRVEGQKPYGHYPAEAPILREILSLRADNLPCWRIAEVLNAGGKPNRTGGQWSPQVIAKILRRENK